MADFDIRSVSDAGAAKIAAARYLALRGSELEWRCAAVLLGEVPVGIALGVLEEQGEDPSHCRRLLETLDDLRALDGALAERLVARLLEAQRPDGSWGSPVETGMIAGFLAKTPFARVERLDAAGDFLSSHWGPDRVKGGSEEAWAEIAAYAHFFANARHENGDAVLQWCGRELDAGFRSGCFDAVRTSRVFVYCAARALPGARLQASELVVGLLVSQAEDGGWGDPARTLDGLVSLTRLA